MNNTNRIYSTENNYLCCLVKSAWGYDIVFPPEETLKSKHVKRLDDAYWWLDYYFGLGEWVLK
jgi:hypothetical protein